MNVSLPNKITVLRLLMIPFIVILLAPYPQEEFTLLAGVAYIISFILFIIASVSDMVDGYIARKYNLVSNFGKIFDPLADKILTSSVFVLFAAVQLISPFIVILILAREFLITGFRSVAAMQNVALSASNWGKHKTIWQIILIINIYCLLIVKEFIRGDIWRGDFWLHLQTVLNYMFYVNCAVVIFLTVYSSWEYLYSNRKLFSSLDDT